MRTLRLLNNHCAHADDVNVSHKATSEVLCLSPSFRSLNLIRYAQNSGAAVRIRGTSPSLQLVLLGLVVASIINGRDFKVRCIPLSIQVKTSLNACRRGPMLHLSPITGSFLKPTVNVVGRWSHHVPVRSAPYLAPTLKRASACAWFLRRGVLDIIITGSDKQRKWFSLYGTIPKPWLFSARKC